MPANTNEYEEQSDGQIWLVPGQYERQKMLVGNSHNTSCPQPQPMNSHDTSYELNNPNHIAIASMMEHIDIFPHIHYILRYW